MKKKFVFAILISFCIVAQLCGCSTVAYIAANDRLPKDFISGEADIVNNADYAKDLLLLLDQHNRLPKKLNEYNYTIHYISDIEIWRIEFREKKP